MKVWRSIFDVNISYLCRLLSTRKPGENSSWCCYALLHPCISRDKASLHVLIEQVCVGLCIFWLLFVYGNLGSAYVCTPQCRTLTGVFLQNHRILFVIKHLYTVYLGTISWLQRPRCSRRPLLIVFCLLQQRIFRSGYTRLDAVTQNRAFPQDKGLVNLMNQIIAKLVYPWCSSSVQAIFMEAVEAGSWRAESVEMSEKWVCGFGEAPHPATTRTKSVFVFMVTLLTKCVFVCNLL